MGNSILINRPYSGQPLMAARAFAFIAHKFTTQPNGGITMRIWNYIPQNLCFAIPQSKLTKEVKNA